MSGGTRRYDASGLFYTIPEKEEPDPFADVSTEELRRRAIEQEAVEASERGIYERNKMLQQFLAETPGYLNTDRNAGRLEARLRNILAARGEVWPKWTREDLHRAADSLYAEGALEISGTYERKSPTEEQMYEMPLHVLRRRAKGDDSRLDKLDV